MSRMLVVLVVLSLFLSALGWVMAAEHEGDPVVTIRPFEPDSSTFWIFGANMDEQSCWRSVTDNHNHQQQPSGVPFATNDPDTDCTIDTNSDRDGYVWGPFGGTKEIWLAPAFENATPLDPDKNIKGKVTLGYTKNSQAQLSPFNFGFAKPTFRLQHKDLEGTTTHLAPQYTHSNTFPDDIEHAPGDNIWVQFEFDFGPAPENISKAGSIKLLINIANRFDSGEINLLAQTVTLSIEERHRGFIELPFTEESLPFTPGYTGGGGGNGSNGGDGDDNGSADAPTAAFDVLPEGDLEVGANVTFNASVSSDPADANLTYAWDFGDGTTGEGVVTSHSYGAAGNYTVTLNVTNEAGLSDTTSQTLTIVAASDGGGSNVTDKESGFLPGFETALVVGVGFVAAAIASRRRETR